MNKHSNKNKLSEKVVLPVSSTHWVKINRQKKNKKKQRRTYRTLKSVGLQAVEILQNCDNPECIRRTKTQIKHFIIGTFSITAM